MRTIDTLIRCAKVLPILPRHCILDDYSIAIHNGVIIDLLPAKFAQQKYAPMHPFDLRDQLVMPGLINAHNHAAMTLFRGLADDLPLMEWLNGHIWPAESKWVDDRFVEHGSMLAIAEMLRSGTTCFNDMYFFPEITARVVNKVGIRASLGLLMLDFPTPWGRGPDDYLRKSLSIFDELKGLPLITTCLAPHAPYTVSDEPLKRIGTVAEELDIPIQMHVHETLSEVEDSVKKYGVRPLERLEKLGLLSPRLQAVHMTQLNEDDRARVKHHGVNVVHCPESNMKLASGICPVPALLNDGVNVALGTDGAASNNDLDMFNEMRSAALLAKIGALDASVMNAEQTLYAATMAGAEALGLDEICGSLEIGKQADLIAINMDSINTQPVYNIHSQLVYALNSQQVQHVWVQGKHLLSDQKLTTVDTEQVKEQAAQWQNKIATTAEDTMNA